MQLIGAVASRRKHVAFAWLVGFRPLGLFRTGAFALAAGRNAECVLTELASR